MIVVKMNDIVDQPGFHGHRYRRHDQLAKVFGRVAMMLKGKGCEVIALAKPYVPANPAVLLHVWLGNGRVR